MNYKKNEIMLTNFRKVIFLICGLSFVISCTNEIDNLTPINQDTSASVFDDPASYRE